jgi:uncharacterized protein YndB with AHSA1/START domain
MTRTNKTEIIKDLPNRRISMKRIFNAPLTDVWRAWTERDLLDQWWVPLPCRAKTKSFDFSEGGNWLYEVLAPGSGEQWVVVEFKKIKKNKSFHAISSFCDRNAVIDPGMPVMHWKNQFSKSDADTEVFVEISFSKDADIERIVAWGLERGFTTAAENLDKIFSKLNAPTHD